MTIMKGHHFPDGKSVMPKAARKASSSVPQVSSAPAKTKGGESVDIRPIDNGYLIEKRTWSDGPKGYKSESKTIYSATKPKIGV